MALDIEEMSVWDLGFRWANLDPELPRLRIPLAVRDNFRLLMKAILTGEIVCSTLCLAKRPHDSKADPKYYIRTYMDEVYECIHGQRFDRKLLKWATLGRMEFLEWCNCRGIPLPEFWFPPGWKLHYEHPHDFLPGLAVRHQEPDSDGTLCNFSYDWPDWDKEQDGGKATPDTPANTSLRQNQLHRLFCRQIASVLWERNPSMRIAEVIRDDAVQAFGGAKYYNEDTTREWIKDLAPDGVRARRGRPRKKNGGEDESQGDGKP